MEKLYGDKEWYRNGEKNSIIRELN
jgi:hypothetical protein